MEIGNENDREMLSYIYETLGYDKTDLNESMISKHWKDIGF